MFARKRAIGLLLVFLLLGAAANVGVAWMCSTKVQATTTVTVYPSYGNRWPFPQAWKQTPTRFIEWSTTGMTEHQVHFSRLQLLRAFDSDMPQPVSGLLAGLPCHLMAGWQELDATTSGRRDVALLALSTPTKRYWLPLRPLWPGFIANTLVYAAILAALWFVPRHLIARARRRHNRCPTPGCNYDLQGLALNTPCPECGRHRT